MTDDKTSLRLPEEFLKRADALIPSMAQDLAVSKHGQVRRSTVLREAIEIGLAQLEQKYGARPAPKKGRKK